MQDQKVSLVNFTQALKNEYSNTSQTMLKSKAKEHF